MLPLAQIRSFGDWRDEVLDLREDRGEEVKKLKRQLNEIEEAYVDAVKLYNFPRDNAVGGHTGRGRLHDLLRRSTAPE